MEERIAYLSGPALNSVDGEPFVDYGRGSQPLGLIDGPLSEDFDFRPFSRSSLVAQQLVNREDKRKISNYGHSRLSLRCLAFEGSI
jgi:hypothetical protein